MQRVWLGWFTIFNSVQRGQHLEILLYEGPIGNFKNYNNDAVNAIKIRSDKIYVELCVMHIYFTVRGRMCIKLEQTKTKNHEAKI